MAAEARASWPVEMPWKGDESVTRMTAAAPAVPTPAAAAAAAPDSNSFFLAKSYLDTQQFLRAAHALSVHPQMGKEGGLLAKAGAAGRLAVGAVGTPRPDLNAKEYFVRQYALYMAGERRKEQEAAERAGPLERCNTASNPYLAELAADLGDRFTRGALDAFGLYMYGLVLRESGAKKDACAVLVRAVREFPLNWSAWLDLASVCSTDEVMGLELPKHWATHAFLAHAMYEGQRAKESLAVLSHVAVRFATSTFVQGLTAKCNYNVREFDVADEQFQALRKADPFRLDDMEIFSNILYVKEARAELSLLAHQATELNKYRPETCCIIGNFYSLRGEHEKAVLHFGRALSVDRNFLSAWTLMGHEFVEMRNTPAAAQVYRIAVDINPNDYRAWYGLGQTYELLRLFNYALEYYTKATNLRPFDARMWCAMGGCYDELGRLLDALECYKRAVDHNDSEGIAHIRLARLYDRLQRPAEAFEAYKQHYAVCSETGTDQGVDTAEALLFMATYCNDAGRWYDAEMYAGFILTLPFPGVQNYLSEAKALLRDVRSRKEGSGREPGARAAANLFGTRVAGDNRSSVGGMTDGSSALDGSVLSLASPAASGRFAPAAGGRDGGGSTLGSPDLVGAGGGASGVGDRDSLGDIAPGSALAAAVAQGMLRRASAGSSLADSTTSSMQMSDDDD